MKFSTNRYSNVTINTMDSDRNFFFKTDQSQRVCLFIEFINDTQDAPYGFAYIVPSE